MFNNFTSLELFIIYHYPLIKNSLNFYYWNFFIVNTPKNKNQQYFKSVKLYKTLKTIFKFHFNKNVDKFQKNIYNLFVSYMVP